ncbi:unnamed protein product [Symbiodinium sp. KB8]|nr:unnamed protein product [Symbiodinium sp. KB8]
MSGRWGSSDQGGWCMLVRYPLVRERTLHCIHSYLSQKSPSQIAAMMHKAFLFLVALLSQNISGGAMFMDDMGDDVQEEETSFMQPRPENTQTVAAFPTTSKHVHLGALMLSVVATHDGPCPRAQAAMMEEVEDDEKTIMFQSSMKKTGLKKECVVAGWAWHILACILLREREVGGAGKRRVLHVSPHRRCRKVQPLLLVLPQQMPTVAACVRRAMLCRGWVSSVLSQFGEPLCTLCDEKMAVEISRAQGCASRRATWKAVTHASLRACEGVEVSGVQAGNQSAFAALMERVSAGRTMVRREEGPKQAVASLIASGEGSGSGPIYVLCFKNEGPHRINSHEGGWKNPEQCKDFTKGKPRLPDAAKGEVVFALEWPEGQATAGQAQCMPIYTEQRIDELLKLGHAHESECQKEVWHQNPLGGAHRLAVYVYVPG